MKLVPRNQNAPYPPGGGFSYTEPKTGRVFDGMLGNAETTARKIIEFKKANPHVFPEGGGDLESTIQLIYAQKWETMPWLFIGGGDDPATPKAQPQTTVCACGENDWNPIFCKTCGPGRITGYVCRKCGKKR
jgi:hypothetical protein